MKKIILVTIMLFGLSSCTYLNKEESKTPLFNHTVDKSITDMNFNQKGTVPGSITLEHYYDIKASGSAIHGCDVIDFGMNNVKKPGYSDIFIGNADDWDIVRIDCRAGRGGWCDGSKI